MPEPNDIPTIPGGTAVPKTIQVQDETPTAIAKEIPLAKTLESPLAAASLIERHTPMPDTTDTPADDALLSHRPAPETEHDPATTPIPPTAPVDLSPRS